MAISVVIGALGLIKRGTQKYFDEISRKPSLQEIERLVLTSSAHILRQIQCKRNSCLQNYYLKFIYNQYNILLFIYSHIYIYIYSKLLIQIQQYEYLFLHIFFINDTLHHKKLHCNISKGKLIQNFSLIHSSCRNEQTFICLRCQVKDLADNCIKTAFERTASHGNNNKSNGNNNVNTVENQFFN